jgi:cathepsin K
LALYFAQGWFPLPLQLASPRLRALFTVLLAVMLIGCGQSANQVPTVPPTSQLPSFPGVLAGPAAFNPVNPLDLAREARDMRAMLQGNLAQVTVRPEQPLEPGLKLPSAAVEDPLPISLYSALGTSPLGTGPQSLLPTVQPAGRTTSAANNLIVDAAAYDVALPNQNVVPGPADDPELSFNCLTDPAAPDLAGGAYAILRFNVPAYPDSTQTEQSLGLLWGANDMPVLFYVALSNWDTGRWDWFLGEVDNVVTVAELAPYINNATNDLLAAIVVLDKEARVLELAQIGVPETRGYGGMAGHSGDPADDITDPPMFIPQKGVSAADLPSNFEMRRDWFGPVIDQGQTQTCCPCAFASGYTWTLARLYQPLWDSSRRPRWITPEDLFELTNGGDCSVGRFETEILNRAQNGGCTRWNIAPLDANCASTWNEAAASADYAQLKIDSWKEINCRTDAALNEIKYYLKYRNQPVMINLSLRPDFRSDTIDGTGVYVHLSNNSWPSNAHEMLITGWDDSRQAFSVLNSWGKEFGDDGWVYVHYDTLKNPNSLSKAYVFTDSYSAATASLYGVDAGALAPPNVIGASQGTFPDKVSVNWFTSGDASLYNIYRDIGTTPIATVPNNQNSYDDLGVTDSLAHTYWVQAIIGSGRSAYSAPMTGYRGDAAAFLPVVQGIGVTELHGPQYLQQGATGKMLCAILNPGGTPLTFSWTFAPGSVEAAELRFERQPVMKFFSPGDYTLTLKVDNDYGSAQRDFPYTVHAKADAPTAVIVGPSTGEVRQSFTFDGTTSTVLPGRNIIIYQWDWTGDNVYDQISADPQIHLTFAATTSYPVKLQVVDNLFSVSDPVTHFITLTPKPVGEIEPNDLGDDANILLLSQTEQGRGNVGQGHGYPNPNDGGGEDWWKFNVPADGDYHVLLTLDNRDFVDYGNVIVYDKDFNTVGSAFTEVGNPNDLDARAPLQFPGGEIAKNPYYIKVFADISTGCFDYSVKWAPGP